MEFDRFLKYYENAEDLNARERVREYRDRDAGFAGKRERDDRSEASRAGTRASRTSIQAAMEIM